MPYSSVIVGTDGSPTATEAVERAAGLAAALGVQLVVVTAFSRPDKLDLGPPSASAGQDAEQWLTMGYRAAVDTAADAAMHARRIVPGVNVDTGTAEGDAAEVLLEFAESRVGSLLVVGNQGMTGSRRFLLGSIPNKVSHHPVGDLLIVRTGEDAGQRPFKDILVGTDGSATAERAVARAAAFAAAIGGALTILTVTADEAAGTRIVEAAGRHADQTGVTWRPLVRRGEAADVIVEVGREHDLVVVGNRGMTGSARFLLGSVPNKVSHHAHSDLLIVKTQ